ncbi:MAG: restriction endonuclease subunit S [Sulfobacillus sp.]
MSEWTSVALANIADIRFSNVDKKTIHGETPVRLCNYMDVYRNDYITSNLPFMEASATHAEFERFKIEDGDVIVTKDSETPDDIGIPAVAVEDIANLVCGYHLALIKPHRETIDPIYLAKQLSSKAIAARFAQLASGSTRYGLSSSAIASTSVPLAPLAQQRRIAEILLTLDEAIAQTEALMAKHQQIREGLMHDLFTRGVTPDGRLRPTREQAPDLYKDSPLGWIPSEWEVDMIGALCSRRVERGVVGLPVMSITMSGGLVPRDSVDRRVESNLTAEGHLLVRRGDIAYNMMRMWQGVLGRAEYDCLISPAYIVMTPSPKIESSFAQYALSTKTSIAWFKRRSYGVVDDRLRLYARDLMRIPMAIPQSLREQCAISERLQSLDESIHRTDISRASLYQQKHGLMHDLLSGHVRVKCNVEASYG